MITHCPKGHRVDVAGDQVGLETRCPTCSQVFLVKDVTSGSAVNEVNESVGAERAPGVESRARHAASDRWADRLNLDVLETLRPAAQLLLLLGLLLALISRGWDSVGDRNAAAATARVQAEITDWNDEWEDRLDRVSQEETSLRQRDDLTAADRDRLDELRRERQRLTNERAIEREKEVQKWDDMERDARETQLENQTMKPWREAVFVFGTILFALGLLVVGYTTEGPVRWFCLALLAIILFGLYMGEFQLTAMSRETGS